ncbi:hypothetical protein E2C01_034301 [Portunus trituberculatus]|uniref:Uncharacterized protein n=1 Tax=Portunus trituberculatus TaxID=210409 RepID=A0A5B7F574_PORTR|nr:hypothetical protein [Portunus trituberculatus]
MIKHEREPSASVIGRRHGTSHENIINTFVVITGPSRKRTPGDARHSEKNAEPAEESKEEGRISERKLFIRSSYFISASKSLHLLCSSSPNESRKTNWTRNGQFFPTCSSVSSSVG